MRPRELPHVIIHFLTRQAKAPRQPGCRVRLAQSIKNPQTQRMKHSASPLHVRYQIPRGGMPRRRVSRHIHARIPLPNITHVKKNISVNKELPLHQASLRWHRRPSPDTCAITASLLCKLKMRERIPVAHPIPRRHKWLRHPFPRLSIAAAHSSSLPAAPKMSSLPRIFPMTSASSAKLPKNSCRKK